jgi:hypothetical protein
MKNSCLLLVGLMAAVHAHAQNMKADSVKEKKIEYYFLFQTGALVGCTTCYNGKEISFSTSTTHGIKIGKRLRVGAGMGLDSYFNWNTAPVFGSVSWDFPGKRNAMFVQFTYGSSLVAWPTQSRFEYGHQRTKAGEVYGFGVGYRIRYEKMRISFGLGSKSQLITSYYAYPTYYWKNTYVAGEPSTKIIKNELNRLAVWMAVGWK